MQFVCFLFSSGDAQMEQKTWQTEDKENESFEPC